MPLELGWDVLALLGLAAFASGFVDAIAGGGGVSLCNSMGNPWTADYLKITGELDVDLRSNIAAEARAKIVYERLINFRRECSLCKSVGRSELLRRSRFVCLFAGSFRTNTGQGIFIQPDLRLKPFSCLRCSFSF